jgi:hypothetical protein
MTIRTLKFLVIAFVLACSAAFFVSGESTPMEGDGYQSTGIGDPEVLRAAYDQWQAEYLRNGGDSNLVLGLDWSKGLSDKYTRASGRAKFDLIQGRVSVEVAGLSKSESWDFWMIDDKPGEGKTVMPEATDVMVRVGTLKHTGKKATLEADLGSNAFANFDIDTIVITQSGSDPTQERYLIGYTTAFYALYRSGQRAHFGRIEEDETKPARPPEGKGRLAKLFDALGFSTQAQTESELANLVAVGRKIFFNETFDGNTRTCGTCHREKNNLTIDPAFIATLDPNDPLFVAEFQEPLFNNFEKPKLMRNVGLILENVDGFQNLSKKFVMRGVPHTLGLNLTLNNGGNVPGFKEATGWSGDGAPGNDELFILGDGEEHKVSGSLFDFAIGAVRQHFTKTLARIPSGGGVEGDFRFPTRKELIALEAFQRSTGRQKELVLPLNLASPLARAGQDIFINGNPTSSNKCNNCHFNAGANFVDTDVNGNVDTNAEDFPLQPGKLIDPNIPRDGGFGTDPNPNGGFGDDTFNIAPIVEAGDTPPFFHNNAVNTVEGSVDFYDDNPGIGFSLNASEVQAIAAFMRVLNALENIRSSVVFENRAKQQPNQAAAGELLDLSIEDLQDAIKVLNDGVLHPDAAVLLTKAITLDQEAKGIANQAARNAKIDEAIAKKNAAKALIGS